MKTFNFLKSKELGTEAHLGSLKFHTEPAVTLKCFSALEEEEEEE